MAKENMLFADGVNISPAIASVSPIKMPPMRRARHRAQAAGNDDDEGQQRVGRADRRRDIEDQQQHDAGRADAGRAQPEGQRIQMLDVEPDHQRAGVVVGAGADRGAEPGEPEERIQRDRDDNGSAAGINLGRVDDQRADLEAVEGIGYLNVLRVGPKHDQQHVDDNDGNRDQQQKLAVLRPGDERD